MFWLARFGCGVVVDYPRKTGALGRGGGGRQEAAGSLVQACRTHQVDWSTSIAEN